MLGPPVLVVIIARILKRKQADIDEVIGEPPHGDPPVGDYLSRLFGGKLG